MRSAQKSCLSARITDMDRYENEGAPVYAVGNHVVNCQVGRGADVTVRQLLKDDCCISSAQSAPAHILPAR